MWPEFFQSGSNSRQTGWSTAGVVVNSPIFALCPPRLLQTPSEAEFARETGRSRPRNGVYSHIKFLSFRSLHRWLPDPSPRGSALQPSTSAQHVSPVLQPSISAQHFSPAFQPISAQCRRIIEIMLSGSVGRSKSDLAEMLFGRLPTIPHRALSLSTVFKFVSQCEFWLPAGRDCLGTR